MYIFESVKKSIETKYSEAELTFQNVYPFITSFIIKFELEVHSKLKIEMLKMEYISIISNLTSKIF